MHYINFDKLSRDHALFRELSEVLAWDARQIYRATQYDEIVAIDNPATSFAREIWSSSRYIPISLIYARDQIVNQAFGDNYKFLHGRNCLVVTDVIVSGHIVREIVAGLRAIGATPVAILTAIRVASSSHAPMVEGWNLPIYSAIDIDSDAVSTTSEMLYSKDLDLQKAIPIITDVDAEIVKYFARHPEDLFRFIWLRCFLTRCYRKSLKKPLVER